ncbi:hypothetical protein DENSPDRAFT_194333 [Dentipellis sp. KUC8613]|nr:hypothetical protein DENSPDRAFT_194333 [Dentipellis sp. KUC8613]
MRNRDMYERSATASVRRSSRLFLALPLFVLRVYLDGADAQRQRRDDSRTLKARSDVNHPDAPKCRSLHPLHGKPHHWLPLSTSSVKGYLYYFLN